MGKIGQTPKIGKLWRRISATVRRTKKLLTGSRKLPGPWTTTWSKHYLSAVHYVTCSLLWVRCLFDLDSLSDFGGKSKVKIFENFFPDSSTGYRTTFRDQISSAIAKLPKGRVVYQTKKIRAPRDSSELPFWPKWADRAQNSLNVVAPWRIYLYRIWFRSAAFCRTYSGKIDFSAQKVNTISFQRTKTLGHFKVVITILVKNFRYPGSFLASNGRLSDKDW